MTLTCAGQIYLRWILITPAMPNCLAMTLWNDWRQLKKATKLVSNSLVTRGNAMWSILGPPIQRGALFYSITGGITSRDTPEEETTSLGEQIWHISDAWSYKSISSSICPLWQDLSSHSSWGNSTFSRKMKTIIVLLSTHDPGILNAVRGYKIAFLLPPVQYTIPKTINFSAQESDNVNAKISKFLEKGRIVHSSHAEGEFISNSFLRPKQDGPFHMIFKLKDINNLFVSITSKWIPSILVPNSWHCGIPTIQCLLLKSTKNIKSS